MICCWLIVGGSIFAVIVSIGMWLHECYLKNNRGIFDWTTGYVLINTYVRCTLCIS
jgi:hypothetical protein